ncbi:MAG: 6-carboxytetrahydropterin synthase [Planctomycetota bacterium]
MFTISVETSFRASHQLTLPGGRKEPVHSHDWLVTADVGSEKLNDMGVVMDFHLLRAMLDEVIAGFSDAALERDDHFRQNNPSAENVAKYIYDKLRDALPDGVKLRNIRVVEEPGCSATFCR